MKCPLCGDDLQEDRRYRNQDAARYPSCGYQARAPKGYFDAALRRSAYEPCSEVFTADRHNSSQRYHAACCRQAAYRLRRESEGIPEVVV